MTSNAAIVAATQAELLHELAMHAYEPKRSDFSQVGKVNVYSIPPRSDRPVSLSEYTYTRDEGVIRGLNFPQQLMLLQLLSERFGMPLRHLTLRENLDASYSPDGQAYRNNVLVPFWVYAGEMIRKDGNNYQVGQARGVEFLPAGVTDIEHAVFEGEAPQQTSGLTIIRYNLGPVQQTQVPTKSGYFADFRGVIPVDSEITSRKTKDSKGYWISQDFEHNLSAVGCVWVSDEQGLYAYVNRPLTGNLPYLDDDCIPGIGTEAPLNK